MRRLVVACVGLLVAGCAGMMGDRQPPLTGTATLKDKDGKQVGLATLLETREGLRIAVTGFGFPPGPKGLHIHEVASCDPPAFTSAGGHFNPTKKQHGRQNPQGPHAGDLPNLPVGDSRQGSIDIVTKAVTLGPGPTSLVGGKGTSIVIHAAADDEKTDPTGNSGARLACGVIVKD